MAAPTDFFDDWYYGLDLPQRVPSFDMAADDSDLDTDSVSHSPDFSTGCFVSDGWLRPQELPPGVRSFACCVPQSASAMVMHYDRGFTTVPLISVDIFDNDIASVTPDTPLAAGRLEIPQLDSVLLDGFSHEDLLHLRDALLPQDS